MTFAKWSNELPFPELMIERNNQRQLVREDLNKSVTG